MAGSYSHCLDEDGNFIKDKKEFYRMIPVHEDFYQACEEMVFIIKFLSKNNPELVKVALDAFYEIHEWNFDKFDNREDCL